MATQFRFAEEKDAGKVLYFIQRFADFQKSGDSVEATEELLRTWMFQNHAAEAFFAMEGDEEIGFVLFNHGFSAHKGRPSIYLECIYVVPEYRGMGVGTELMRELSRIARERDYVRVEGCAPDWNPGSGRFYNSLGAEELNGWTLYRIHGETLSQL